MSGYPNLAGYALRPFVRHLALASRLAMPSTNKLITSLDLGHCTQARLLLDFRSDEGRASLQGWYAHQGRNTRFTLLEYRKYKRGQVKHEFIVVWLNNTTLCRFDRRASDGKRGHILREEGAPAEDSAHILSSFETEYKELLDQTDVLLTIKLPDGEDLGVILAVCEGIQTHAKASAYNLMSYNCYFFSWMIIAAIGRRTYSWETATLSKEGWNDVLRTSLTQVFPPPGLEAKLNKPRTIGRKLSSIFTRSGKRSQNDMKSFTVTFNIKKFQDELLSQYSNSYQTIHNVLQKLLLRSQVGPTLNKELVRLESDGVSSVKRAMAKRRALKETVEYAVHKLAQENRSIGGLEWNDVELYLRSQISEASTSAANSLIANGIPGDQKLWEDAWRNGWSAPPRSKELKRVHDRILFETQDAVLFARAVGMSTGKEDSLARKAAEEWEDIGSKAMHKWKDNWDECERLGAQYAASVTVAVMATVTERLRDIAPEQLVFGDSIKLNQRWSKGPASLQEFIRSRMQEHFEMVDRFGFGSSRELIRTTEEVMCEIWMISLHITDADLLASIR
ncbi:hypothetical protein RSOLAG1IB_04875 [Rhizoctonia solani AG-1 IB]|uniref:Uncharacterized protein n=1 Tax=Thanatephorus cucumeris (strain AG1-IB / isolate 7/3/14) TaxID=1108050 RepID=A0A0B7G099_THACB|nr:hypothetical protein RSOLAG1IB_04875 [Rhizoctonia solani AG-1 IB]